jgi:DNA-binding NarL/FixJ family response regulator
MDRYRIIIADDHALLRRGLRKVLAEAPELEIVAEVGDGLELLKLLRKVSADMILLDISMPNLRGLEAIREIKAIRSQIKILVLTMHKEKEYLYQAVTAGAEGYVLKEDTDSELVAAIDTIRRGRFYLSPLLSADLTDDWVQIFQGKKPRPFEPEPLTTREKEILKLIAESKSSREIGALLFISRRTVERHRANIMDKLKLKNTADLIKYALQKGYV